VTEALDAIRTWPWAWGWSALFAIVTLRAGATYGIGRAIAAGWTSRREPSERLTAATAKVIRWGPPAVALSFLTVGAQTVINLGAGLAGMSFPRYLTGLLPGAAIWATVWFTVGMGIIEAVRRGDTNQIVWAVLAALIVLAILIFRSARTRV